MPADAAKAVVQRLNEALGAYFRTGNASVLDDVLAPDFVHHLPGMPPDREGLKQALSGFRAAFPDLQVTTEELLAEGDRVTDRLTWTATQQGPLMGVPPTGKRVTVSEIHVARVAGDKIVERWGQWDALGLLQQLGAVPAPA